ncbi:Hydroxypyruvate isomerase [Marinibacterium anthonyi]|nr:Hydroxypyruvate isomerase [Marinibacterium anthonyi]
MRIGFYTNYTPEIAAFAERIGFRSLELSAWPHSFVNPERATTAETDAMMKDLAARDIEVSALGYYPNVLSQDEDEAEHARDYLMKVITQARRLGVPVVATFAGRNPHLSVEDNLPGFKEVYSRIMDHAETEGVKIAMENCPMMDRFTMEGENIAFSPEIWKALFELVPSDHLGLELDPSHFIWQRIDYVKAVKSFGDRIFHVHAKDMEIRHDLLAESGIYGVALSRFDGLGHGWWRARTPGWGEVDWAALITALIEVGYKGNIDIEHEDDVFAEVTRTSSVITEEEIVSKYGTERKGLELGYKTLAQYVPNARWPGVA